MRGTLRAMTIAGLLIVLAAAGLAGQTRIVLGVGGGGWWPCCGSSFGSTGSKSYGYLFQGMVGVAPGSGKVSIRFDGQYGSLTNGTISKDRIFVVNADLVLHPSGGGSVRPYLMAGPTYGHFSVRGGTTNAVTTDKFGLNGGAGLNIGGTSKIWFFTEARYVYTKDHKYIPITVGIRINTGPSNAAK